MARQVRPWQVKPFLHRERKAREGDQEPASIFHQGQRHRRTKVRMYGCNLYLLAVMRLSAWQTGGDHVCVKTLTTCHVRFDSARFESTKSREIEPTCPKMHCTIGGSRVFTHPRPTAVLFSMFCGSGAGVSGDKIRRNFDGERTALPMRT